MTDQIWWFATRGAGLMTWVVSAASIILGVVMSSKLMGKQPGFPWLLDLHRFFSTLTSVFLAVHLITLWADSFVEFGPMELFVPFTSEWRPAAVAWGILSMYCLAAVQLSSLVKDRLPANAWHTIHLLSYGSFVTGSVHAWQSGSDVSNPIVLSIALAMTALIVGLTAHRVLVRTRVAPAGPTKAAAPSDRAAMLARARAKQNEPAAVAPTPKDRWAEAAGRR